MIFLKKLLKYIKVDKVLSKFNFTIVKKIKNKKVSIPVLNGIGFGNLSLNYEYDWFYNLIENIELPANALFIDVGVNVGQTILTFRSLFNNKYIGFEPNPSCVNYLNHLIKKNNFNNISIIPIGLSSKNELSALFLEGTCDSGATVIPDFRPGRYNKEKDRIFIPVFAFDTLNLVDTTETISLIKIDVECAELEVLHGMKETIQRYKPIIVCEILDANNDSLLKEFQNRADALFTLMKNLDYTIYKIDHRCRRLTFEKISGIKLTVWSDQSMELNDYIFIHNELSISDIIKTCNVV